MIDVMIDGMLAPYENDPDRGAVCVAAFLVDRIAGDQKVSTRAS